MDEGEQPSHPPDAQHDHHRHGDKQRGDGGDHRVGVVLQRIEDSDREGGRVRPDQEQRDGRLVERDDEAAQQRACQGGAHARQRHPAEYDGGRGAEVLRRLLLRPVQCGNAGDERAVGVGQGDEQVRQQDAGEAADQPERAGHGQHQHAERGLRQHQRKHDDRLQHRAVAGVPTPGRPGDRESRDHAADGGRDGEQGTGQQGAQPVWIGQEADVPACGQCRRGKADEAAGGEGRRDDDQDRRRQEQQHSRGDGGGERAGAPHRQPCALGKLAVSRRSSQRRGMITSKEDPPSSTAITAAFGKSNCWNTSV